jgi:hypothetical protein
VVTNDESTYCGPIWEWNPREGFFSMSDAERGLVEIRLADVHVAYKRERVDVHGDSRKIDMLERARLEGWDGT